MAAKIRIAPTASAQKVRRRAGASGGVSSKTFLRSAPPPPSQAPSATAFEEREDEKHFTLCQRLRRAGSKSWPKEKGPRPSTTTMPPA